MLSTADIELADLFASLRSEIEAARAQAKDEDARFRIESVDLELHVAVEKTKQAEGGVKFWVLSGGLRRVQEHGDAHYVLKKLLVRDDLTPAEQRAVVRTTLRWLESHRGTEQAAHVLGPLNASSWPAPLGTHMPQFKSRLVLRALLAREQLSADQARQAGVYALKWLRAYEGRLVAAASKGHGQEIVELLLARADTDADTAEQARRFATLLDRVG
ncbi:trypco2 family protein [Streptomyces reticuli]|uniref:trypco2 family protein n=1 Tax=Streptomyces reticuli TaxID=1926 RepID=UPI00073DE154|nr:hypothetical protein TUE45_02599 [Streptomyces reticuli]